MSVVVGRITHLFTKPRHEAAMAAHSSVQVKVGLGIDGDVNAQTMGLRQVLLVRTH
jgi:hypothetical protein